MRRFLGAGAAMAIMTLATACGGRSGGPMAGAGRSDDVATSGAWRSLLDPQLSAWRGYRESSTPAGWSVVDGVLVKRGEANDLVSRDEFGNFELAFDWRIEKGGNAGVFYRGTEEYDHIYWTGPEYQLLDDAGHPDGRNRMTSAGSAYALYAPPAGVVKPAGEWNSSRIVVQGSHVEHWLNGQKVVEYELGSADWLARVAKSKFHEWPHYGLAPRGHIGLQGDHPGTLEMRGLRIRELP